MLHRTKRGRGGGLRRHGVVHDLPVKLIRLDVDAVQVVAASHTELKGHHLYRQVADVFSRQR